MAEYYYRQPTDEEVRQFWSTHIRPKESIMELNFKEKAVTIGSVADGGQTTFIDESAWENIVLKSIPSLWHDPGKDEIEHLLLYNNDQYLCQRKKLKYDFSTNSSYWDTYNFKDGSVEDVKKIYEIINTTVIIQREIHKQEVLEEARKLNLEALNYYYDKKWYKKMDEIQKMLLYSDWRVLPDSPQKFDGERDLWVTWRQKLRELLPDNPRDIFSDNFEMFKYVQTLKYPIDPRVYFDRYPNLDVEYLSTEDQFEKYDFQASKDFVGKTQLNLINFLESYNTEFRPIDAKVLELAKKLKLENVYSGLDYEKFVAENEITPNE